MSLLKYLKHSTETLHYQIEENFPFKHILKKDLDSQRYQACLQVVFWGHHAVVENCKKDHQLSYWNTKHTHCCNLLSNDIVENSATEILLTNSSSHAFTLGMLYVMEGSALGAKLIAKHLRQKAKTESLPTNYYTFLAASNDWVLFSRFIEDYYQRKPTIKSEVLLGAKWQYQFLLSKAHTLENDEIKLV